MQGLSCFVSCLPCHTLADTGHKTAPLGKELYCGFGVFGRILIVCSQRAQGHVGGIVSWCAWLVVDREDARVEFLVVAVIILCHGLAEEVLFRPHAVRLLRHTPVQLPLGVGPQFVVAGIQQCVGKGEIAMPLSVLQRNHLALHKETVIVQQFAIQDATYVGGASVVASLYVCLVVYGIPQIITAVIHMKEHLFLWQFHSKGLETCHQAFHTYLRMKSTATHGGDYK